MLAFGEYIGEYLDQKYHCLRCVNILVPQQQSLTNGIELRSEDLEGKQGNYLFGYADEDLAEHLEQIRLGEKEKNNEKLTKYDKKSV